MAQQVDLLSWYVDGRGSVFPVCSHGELHGSTGRSPVMVCGWSWLDVSSLFTWGAAWLNR